MTYRSVQCNVQGTDPAHSVQAHMQEVIVGVDEVGWNELSHFGLQEYARTQLEGFETYSYVEEPTAYHDTGQIAISWRTSVFEAVAHGYTLNNKGVAHITPRRGVAWVLLRHRASGKLHYRQVTHAPHHIEVAGKPRVTGALAGQNARAEKLFGLVAGMLLRMVAQGMTGEGQPAPVFGTGDLNVNWRAEKALPPEERTPWFPYTVLGLVADIVVPSSGTHGDRIIDWGWAAGCAAATAQTLPRGSSDHNPVLFDVTLP